MRTMITLPDHIHARAKQRAAEFGISLAELGRRLFAREVDGCGPQGNLEDIVGMVTDGEPFSMAEDGERIIAEAVSARFE